MGGPQLCDPRTAGAAVSHYVWWYLAIGMLFSSLAMWQEARIRRVYRRGTDWIFYAAAVVMLALTWPFWLLKVMERSR